jgi:hypothetical protein
MSDLDAVLFANEAFYRAFADRDTVAMEALWSANAPVCCIHPGWEAIYERDDIIESWRAVLEGATAPEINCLAPRVYFYGDAAFVVCFEEIHGDHLIATNYFVREEGRWKMVHHQAGPTRAILPPDAEEPTRTVN